MSDSPKKVIVIGCGIAGPVLALALHRAGIESEIFEAKNTLDGESGLFHYISPNGMNVFNALGIYEKIKSIGHDCDGVIHYDEKGKPFAKMNEKDEEKIYGAGSIMIKRGLLTQSLREEVISNGLDLHFGKKLKSIENIGESEVLVHFEDGSDARGSLLVGCDGIHSRTRQIMIPNAPEPTYTKMIVSGGYTHIPMESKEPNIIHTNYCKKSFLAYYVLPDGETWWWNGMSYPQKQTREQLEKIPNEQWQQTLIELYSEDHNTVQELVKKTSDKFFKYPIYEMPSLQTWHKDNVCLIGDAAHAISPHAGQGASMAMEDAITLAKCLRDVKDTKNAFVQFQLLRKKRVEKIAKIALTTGENYFLTSSIKKAFRNSMMKLMYTPLFFNRMAKFFFGYNVKWNEHIK